MKHLYMMRHGETLFNKKKLIQGWCDSPLTEDGVKQAERARELLKEIDFDHYYSSTSERCCDTLEIVAPNANYVRLKGLKERNFGDFEGESEFLNPKQGMEITYETLFPYYHGEKGSEATERVVSTIHEIMDKEDHENVLAVSHGGACFFFLCSVCDPMNILKNNYVSNCSIFHYTYDNGKYEFIEVLTPKI
ncbi:MAG: histidine phosphatase family protein [Erysipelotrichales bacterium]|nr:histidine phosphatase family protein [Erysipelotrichales bacterium]